MKSINKRPATADHRLSAAGRSGQVMIFMVLVLVIILMVVLWNFDLHKILFVKNISRNGGDAAALAAARWQGISLNIIGELNIMQAVAISDALTRGETNFTAAAAIADLEARLNLVGPMIGFAAAQQAAKNNGIFVNSDYTRAIRDHAVEVVQEYNIRYPAAPYTNDPSPPTCWDDYAQMLQTTADNGIAAAPDNIHFFYDYANQDHFLLMPDFYDAVASADWCWFYFNAMALLENYAGFQDWPALPIFEEPQPINSEIFGLGLRVVQRLEDLPALYAGPANPRDVQRELESMAGHPLHTGLVAVAAEWFCYREETWMPWTDYIDDDFPFHGVIRELYNVAGADAAVRIETPSERLTPGAGSDTIVWSAAAKPLGYLEGDEQVNRYALVLPAFHDVRLIPIDASSAPAPGSRPGWGLHIYEHLEAYAANGPGALDPSCWYCRQLRLWENAEYRRDGLDWLDENNEQCREYGPGSGPGGGSRRPH